MQTATVQRAASGPVTIELPSVLTGSEPTVLLGASAERDPVETVLVKFNLSNRNRIPAWIPEVDRASDREVDTIHQMEARKDGLGSLATLSRVRRGRIDTGFQIKSVGVVHQAAFLRRGLVNNGINFRDAHWFQRLNRQNRLMFTVVVGFEPGVVGKELPRDTLEGLRELTKLGWGQCYVWDNPDGTVTINFVGLVPDKPFTRALRIHDGAVTFEDITAAVTEEQE